MTNDIQDSCEHSILHKTNIREKNWMKESKIICLRILKAQQQQKSADLAVDEHHDKD